MIKFTIITENEHEEISKDVFNSCQEAIDYINAIWEDEKENDTSSEKRADLEAEGVKIEE